jgi:hypothetical protein
VKEINYERHIVNCIAGFVRCVASVPFLTVMSYRTLTLFKIRNDNLQVTVVCKAKKTELHRNKLIKNLKKRIENIISLIEGWCKKKIVFARPLLSFGSIREANAHCTHLQIAQVNPQTEICKKVQFLRRFLETQYSFNK